MRVLIVRHAPAGDKEAFARTGNPDSERPLTAEGKRKMRKAAAGLRRLIDADIIGASPLVRARETADILALAYPKARRNEMSALSPGSSPARLMSWLAKLPSARKPVLVGHEPHLGSLIGYLTSGLPRAWTELKKGGACLLSFAGRPAVGQARVEWLLKPAQLRKLGRAR